MEEKKAFWKQERNLWIVFAAVLVIIGAIFARPLWRQFGPEKVVQPTPASSGGGSGAGSSAPGQVSEVKPEDLSYLSSTETYRLLQRVRLIPTDFGITADERFKKLQSFEVEIVVPELGRSNPFLNF